jgi:hypothetical protein
MQTYRVGHRPGMVAPEAIASLRPVAVASVVPDGVAPAGLKPQGESARAVPPGSCRASDDRQGSVPRPDADKEFCTLRAVLALKGHCLSRTYAGDGPVLFYVTRWGMVRELLDLAAVRAFAAQVGCSHA